MQRVTTREAKTHLSKILARVEQGEEFTICRGEVPVALVSPVVEARRPKQRPAVGTITSAGVCWSSDALTALSGEHLTDWGL